MGIGFHTAADPLTCDLDEIWRYDSWPRTNQGRCVLCDVPEFACHRPTCSFSPIWAELVVQYQDALDWNAWLDLVMASTQTVINCAQCGRPRLAKDMDVVYRHWDSDIDPFNIANIKKAVCPEHNRKGKVGWVYERS